jgi:hypothetical protein
MGVLVLGSISSFANKVLWRAGTTTLLSVVVARSPTVGIGRPILLTAPWPVGSIERGTRIVIGTTGRAASPSAFFDDAIMPCRALTNWEAGIGS